MTTLWRYSFDDGTYSHAYLIPVIVGYLFYDLSTSKELIFRQQISWFALVILLFSAYLLFVTSTAQISLGYWLATLLLLCTSINSLFKTNFKVLFPAFYFIFLIPVWGLLTIPLQDLSVMAVNIIMGFTSIPVFVEDQFVHIPSGIFEIAGGCSGLRYLLTSLAISSLYIFLYLRRIKNIFIFAFVAIFGALLTNWLRISMLIIIGHQTEMTSSLMTDHNMFGWYLYIPFMLLLFKLGGYLTDKESINNHDTSKTKNETKNLPNWKLTVVLLVVLLLSSTSLKQNFISNNLNSTSRTTPLKIMPIVYHYSSLDVIKNSDSFTHLIYNFEGDNLEGKASFFDNNLIPKGWNVIRKEIENDQQIITIKKGSNKALLTINYKVAENNIATVSQLKKERFKAALVGQGKSSMHWQFKKLNDQKQTIR